MINTIQERLTQLKCQYADYELTDDDYYESDEVAEFNMDAMFKYFRDELDQNEEHRLIECANNSKLFLHDLIGVGETMLAEAENSPSIVPMSWGDLGGMRSMAQSARQVALSRSDGLKLNFASTQLLAADSSGLDITSELPFGATVNVYQDDDQIIVKVTSEDTSLEGKLVGYCFSGSELDRLGFTLLRAGVLGSVSGIARINRNDLIGEQTLNFTLVDSSDICKADLPLLEEAISGDSDDQRSIKAWRRWISRVSKGEDGLGLAACLQRLIQSLP